MANRTGAIAGTYILRRRSGFQISLARAGVTTTPSNQLPCRRMQPPRSQRYRQAAAECTRAAEHCQSPTSAAFFLDLAQRWNDLAREQEAFERLGLVKSVIARRVDRPRHDVTCRSVLTGEFGCRFRHGFASEALTAGP